MSTLGVIKRIVPFFITLTIGLLIASFFVDLAPRSFAFPEGRRKRCRNFERLYMEERERNDRLESEIDRLRQNPITLKHTEPWDERSEFYVPPPVAKSPRTGR